MAKSKEELAEYYRKWRENNQERLREYRERNREHIKEQNRQWRIDNAEHVREKKREWTKNHPGNNNERAKRWAENNPEKSKKSAIKSSKKWRENNKDKVKFYATISQNRRRLAVAQGGTKFTLEEWNDLLDRTGHMCMICEIPEAEAIHHFNASGNPVRGGLTIDHRHPLSRGGNGSIKNIQSLCLPCNILKRDRLMSELDAKFFSDAVNRRTM